MIDARIHRVFGMPRVFNKLMAELVTGHIALVVEDVGAGRERTCRTIVGFTL